MRIGYLGPGGTFTEEAAIKWAGERPKRIAFDTLKLVIMAVPQGEVDESIVPIENFLEGGVDSTSDTLIRLDGIKIRGEITIPVKHNLIGFKKLNFSQIKKVVSKKEAIGQCQGWLEKKLRSFKVLYAESTAEAVKEIEKYGDPEETVVIGTILAAKLYGGKIIARNIQDHEDNASRFVIIAKRDVGKPTGDDKTSIIFEVQDKPGSLVRILEIFDVMEINMTEIESRPSKRKMGEYIFWVDIAGHRKEEKVKVALELVERKSAFLKILGSYPRSKEA